MKLNSIKRYLIHSHILNNTIVLGIVHYKLQFFICLQRIKPNKYAPQRCWKKTNNFHKSLLKHIYNFQLY